MHGYEIQRLIQASRMDIWTNILSGSIYYALNKMESDGLIPLLKSGPVRDFVKFTVLRMMAKLFQKMIRETLTLPPHTVKSDFSLGLVWIESVPKQEAVELAEPQAGGRIAGTMAFR